MAQLWTIGLCQPPKTATRPPAPTKPVDPMGPGGTFHGYAQDPKKNDKSPVCEWRVLEVGDYNDDLRQVYVGGPTGAPKWIATGETNGVITEGPLEIQVDQSTRDKPAKIHYHCLEPGSVVLYYAYAPYTSKRRDTAHLLLGDERRAGRIQVECVEE
jgi:hypothetical protein